MFSGLAGAAMLKIRLSHRVRYLVLQMLSILLKGRLEVERESIIYISCVNFHKSPDMEV